MQDSLPACLLIFASDYDRNVVLIGEYIANGFCEPKITYYKASRALYRHSHI